MSDKTMPPSFSSWLGSQRRSVKVLFGLFGLSPVPVFLATYKLLNSHFSDPYFPVIWLGTHAFVATVLFALLRWRTRVPDEPEYPEASDEVRQLWRYAQTLWISWVLLYGAFTVRSALLVPTRASLMRTAVAIRHEAEADSTIVIGAFRGADSTVPLVLEASRLAAEADSGAKKAAASDGRDMRALIADYSSLRGAIDNPSWIGFLDVLNNVQTVFLMLMFITLAYPKDRRNLNEAILMGLLVTAVPLLASVIHKFPFDPMAVLGGFAAGTALALLTGRLDSKFLGTPLWPIVCLYAYAILQATFFTFAESDVLFLVVSGLAMFLKIALFLVLSWLLSSDLFLYYFQELRWLFGGAVTRHSRHVVEKNTVEDRQRAFFEGLTPARKRYKEACRQRLISGSPQLGERDPGKSIDVSLGDGALEAFDVVLEDKDGRMVVAECARWLGQVTDDDIAKFTTRINNLRTHLQKPIAAVYCTSFDFRLSAEQSKMQWPSVALAFVAKDGPDRFDASKLTYSSAPIGTEGSGSQKRKKMDLLKKARANQKSVDPGDMID